MRIDPFSLEYSEQLQSGTTWLESASGSNTLFGGDVVGDAGDLSVVGLRSAVSLSSNLGSGNSIGDVLALVSLSPLTAQFSTASNSGGGSFGSNATRVSASSFVGASSNGSREDHIHDGIGTVTASSSNTLDRGTLNLRPGTGVSFGLTDSDGSGGLDTLTINSTATGGGGGGSTTTIQYGSLKPATPLDDFNASSLNGAWSAHSSTGSFATTDCYTQAVDGSHLSMGYNAKMGLLYRSTTNVDQEWLAGGMHTTMVESNTRMFGIAVLDSSGTGVGVVAYTDGNAYLANITTWLYASLLQTFSGYGLNFGSGSPYDMRLTRVGNSWTGYISQDGMNWVASSSSSVTITAANLAVGLFYDGAGTYHGRMFCDWVHKV